MAMALPMLRPGLLRGMAAPQALKTLARIRFFRRPSLAASSGLLSSARSETN
jgi:hypothetical protein